MEETTPESTAPSGKNAHKITCPNCDKKISQKAVFCPKCGQKQSSAKVSMRDFLWKLWFTTFHLDSRVLRTFAGVISPGKLTLAYFAGKQKKYFHPVQFFFIVLFFLLLSVSYLKKGNDDSQFQIFQIIGEKDPIHVKARMEMRDSILKFRDSLPASWRTPLVFKAVDSLTSKAVNAPRHEDSLHLKPFHQEYVIAYEDIIRLPTDSLMEFYQLKPGFERFLLYQVIRSGLHSKELGKFWVGTISWAILVLTAVMAGWLKLLYIRRKRYFVEHFVLMLHMQTGLMVWIILGLWADRLLDSVAPLIIVITCWITIGFFIAFYRYYKQSFLKTFAKGTLFGFLYLISFILVVTGSLAATILLF